MLAILERLLVVLFALAVMAASAAACTGGAATTSLKTSLSGGGKEGEEITVSEGSGVKDTATLSGENSGKAGGTVKYSVYSDKECKTLVTKAGEVTVKEGKVPASEEKKLEAGAVYYWQAVYSGDSNNSASTSACGKEVLTVKATTTLSTSLKGGGKEGESITVSEGSKVKDQATLSGTKSSTAKGTIKYAVYKDKECKELATEAGKGEVKEGKAPESEEKELEAGAVYYWQAEYGGDSLHEAATSVCSKEVETVKAKVTLSTKLSGGGKEGEEITVAEGSKVKDTATLSGTNASGATGTVDYSVYKDKECKELVTEAGEGKVEGTKVASSEEKELEAGAVYYWQAKYLGDSLHEESTSTCSKEVLKVKANTSLSTKLSGGGKEGEEITVAEGSKVKDTATLSGTNASGATGTVDYSVYKDKECKELVTEAGEGKVEGTKVASSEEKELEAGAVYYWLAEYLGDSLHEKSLSACSKEVETVKAKVSLSTELSDEEQSGEKIEVQEESAVSDTATLSGKSISTASGTVKYFVYSDEGCEELEAEAGKVTVKEGKVPASEKKKLKAGVYYWRAEYSGDETHEAVTSVCGDEVETVAEAVQSEWMVEGKTLSELKLSEKKITLISKPVSLLVPSLELMIECKKVEGEGEISQEGGEEFEAKLTECAAVGSEACKVEPMVMGVKTQLIYAGGSFYDAIRSSKEGVPLTKVVITGEKCSLPKESTVKGSYAAEVSQEEEEEPPLTFSKGISEAVNAALKSEGKTELSLTFGEKSAAAYFTGAFVPPIDILPRQVYRWAPFTRLCGEELTRCREPWIYPSGTWVQSKAETETVFQWGHTQVWIVGCLESSFKFQINGSGGRPLLATTQEQSEFNFIGCESGCRIQAKNLPYAVEVIAANTLFDGGKVIVEHPEFEFECPLGAGPVCVYGAKKITFTVTPGGAFWRAKMKLGLVNLQKKAGSHEKCTQAASWEKPGGGEMEYKVVSPDGELGELFFVTM